MDYLKSEQAVKDYAQTLQSAKFNKDLFKSMWEENLQTHNALDVTTQDVNENDILPEKILANIQSNVNDSVVLSHFNPVFNIEAGTVVIDNSTDTALGHKKLATKKLQNGILAKRTITPEAIYKLQRLDHMTFLKGGALVAWLLDELPKHVVRRLEQALLVGGVTNEDGSSFDAIMPVVGDSLQTKVSATDIFSGIIDGIAAVNGDSADKFVFINPNDYASLLKSKDNLSLALLMGTVNLGATLVPTDLIPAGASGKSEFVVVNTSNYLLGFSGTGIETLSDFEIKENAQYVESRVYCAGTIMSANSIALVDVTDSTTPAK